MDGYCSFPKSSIVFLKNITTNIIPWTYYQVLVLCDFDMVNPIKYKHDVGVESQRWEGGLAREECRSISMKRAEFVCASDIFTFIFLRPQTPGSRQ